jgi:outer membrane protein insertion porin family
MKHLTSHSRCSLALSLALWVGILHAGTSAAQVGSSTPQGGAPQATTQGSKFVRVDDVEIEGNERIDRAAIRLQLKYTSGNISSEQISEDVKTLYRTGFFEQVTASVVQKSGRAFLRYLVSEKPVVRRVFIKGNEEVDQSDLASVFQFDARRFFDRTKVDQMIRKGVSLYQTRGFYDASFEYALVPVGENQVDLSFTVTEGERYKIREIAIRGIERLEEDDVLSAMETRRYKWWSSWLMGTGRLNVESLQNDQLRVRQYLLDHGLIDGNVSAPVIERREDGLYLAFDVTEGPEYKVGAISAAGDLIENDAAKTIEGIKVKEGDVFSASAIREDSFHIAEKFNDIGYAFANVVPNTQVDKSTATVNIDYSATRGNLTTVNKVNIKGNDKTYDNVIRREIRLDEQDLYSGSKVKRSQAVLQRLGYFEEVNIATEPVGDDKVDLNVAVREGSTGTFSAGAGYSTSDGPLFNARLSENNLFGTGRKAVLNVDIGTQRDSYVISFEDRRFNDTFWSLGTDIYRTDREFRDFDRQANGVSLSAGYPLEELLSAKIFEDMSFGLKYEFLEAKISNVDEEDAAQLVIDSEGTTRASAITPRLVRNTINNPLNPTEGSRQEISVELAGLGGTEEFYLFEIEQSLYYPLGQTSFGDFVFSWRTQFGYGETFDDDPFPLYRRYFPGGINSVRGFKNRTLGPKDERGNEYGGSKQLVNNVELIFPLINSAGLKGVVFYDIGQSFDDDESIDLSALREAYGAGIRWSSPLGPIRIEFGFPLDRQEGESNMVTQFSFGAPF